MTKTALADMLPLSELLPVHTKTTYRNSDRLLRRGEWRIPIFWGLGLWGYITSYKGISTNFVLREPSVYQNISDCLFYNQKACWSQLISLLCPYTIKTLWNCKYAKIYKTKAFFCGNLSTVAHFNSFLKIFECKMIVFFTFEWFIVHYDHFSQQ